MRECKYLTLLLAMILLSGCAVRRHVQTYNARVYAECRQKYTEQQCRALTMPSCDPTAQVGEPSCQ